MKYYLAIDNGGTKTAAILYDIEFNRLGVCVSGSLRSNTNNAALVDKHLDDLAAGLDLYGKTIEELGGTYEASVVEKLQRICTVKSASVLGEMEMGLSAAGIFGDGLLALCGTGATFFARISGKKLFTGGYGASVADEGSGYYIGRSAFISAIRDKEERGERTVLTDLIPQKLGFSGRDELQAAIFSIYGKSDRSPVTQVAGFAPLVIDAASEGDEVSLSIIKEAGRLAGEQMRYLIKSNGIADSVPLTVSGSIWRSNPVFLKEFEKVTEKHIIIPQIEPILGVLASQKKKITGVFDEDDAKALSERYPEFKYSINENKETK